MSLSERTAPVKVLGYGHYGKPDNPLRRNDGSVVETVQYLVPGEELPRTATLDASVNGSRVEPGTETGLLVESRIDHVVKQGANGHYAARVEKRRVVGFAA